MNNLFETDKKWATTFVLNHPSKVYLHSTEEITGNDILPSFTWDVSFSIDLLITMKQTYTTDDAKQLTIGQRKCIFQGEEDLDYFKNDVYSLSACMIQCRMNKANKLCKCIPPFYAPATGSYRECSLSDFKCLRDNRENITDIRGCPRCELSCLNTVYESEKFTKK
jgi:acid-sensing ion channel, other